MATEAGISYDLIGHQARKEFTLNEGLNGANVKSSNGLKFNRRPLKKSNFYRLPSKKQVSVIVKSHDFSCSSWSLPVSMLPNILT